MNIILACIIYSLVLSIINGSHYRGGFITWKPQNPRIPNQNPVVIILKQRHVWRRGSAFCNDTSITNRLQVGAGDVKCISKACYNIHILASAGGPCVEYSAKNDWSAGEVSTAINISTNISFEAGFKGNAWIVGLEKGANGGWSISTGISTIPRSDGTYNTPPSIAMSSIKLLYVGSTYTWKIPVADSNGDIVRCRWANNTSVDECAAVCDGFPGAILDSDACTLTYNATKTGFWGVALKIEDFEFSTQITPLSSASIQFIVQVSSPIGSCATPPFYYGRQPADACVSARVNSTIHEVAQFSIGCSNTTLIEVETYKPNNMIVGSLTVDPFNSSLYTMNITWTPTSTQSDVNLVCYTPLDNLNRQGNPTCIKYFVTDDHSISNHAKYINESRKPTGKVHSNQSEWYIQYNTEVRRPKSDAYIYFYSKSTDQLVHRINVRTDFQNVIYSGKNLTFFTTKTWNISEEYYILFDGSIVTDPSVCGPQSPTIIDPNYWTFEIISNNTEKRTNETNFLSEISLSSMLRYRRSESFYISSNILLNRNDSLLILMEWTISNYIISNSIITNLSELFIPARTLPYGIYQFQLTVTMTMASDLTSSVPQYIEIIRSNIQVNLIQYGTSMITYPDDENLILDPGKHSIDPDQNRFNFKVSLSLILKNLSTNIYEYYYRTIEKLTFEKLSLSNAQISWSYHGIFNSSIIIYAGSLKVNQSYEWMAHLKHRWNTSIESRGYLHVHIQTNHRSIIAITCLISRLCHSNFEYPKVQLTLLSHCIENCSKILNITWNVYRGEKISSNQIQWTSINQIDSWSFGRTIDSYTVTPNLFQIYSQIKYWRFEVIYSFLSGTSSSSLKLALNSSPRNGSCSIYPRIGTINTLFNISCSNWFDEDEIQEYSVWDTNPYERSMIAFSNVDKFQVRLPSGNENTSELNLIVVIRDRLNSITEWNLSPLVIQSDRTMISNLLTYLDDLKNQKISSNEIVRRLTVGNQNIIAQIIIQLSHELNRINFQNLYKTMSSQVAFGNEEGLPITSIYIAPLGRPRINKDSSSLTNRSALNEYNQLLTIHAEIREFLIQYLMNLAIFGVNSIELQASALVQLTSATNELTLTTALFASERCLHLTRVLFSLTNDILFEDLQSAASVLFQCISNVITAIHRTLQEPISKRINNHAKEIVSLLTASLNVHLNIDQKIIFNTSSVFMTLKKTSFQSI